MKKKGYIILISVLLLGILLGIGRAFFEKYQNNKLEKHVIDKYGFEISYSKAYKEIISTSENIDDKLSNLTVTESGEQIAEYMQNLNLVETVRNLKNKENGIKFIIDAINKEKTKLSLEEICKRYIVMFKVYNEEQIVKESNVEIIKIGENEAGKVTIKVNGETSDSLLIAYLLPLEDKEITLTFIAPEEIFIQNENEIDKIVNSLKIY